MNTRKTNQIGIAVVEYQRHFLVGIRDTKSPLPGYHEFPGGKCLTDEPARLCAIRECREETGLEVIALKELLYQEHSYEHADVKLHFWLCQPAHLREDLLDQNLKGFDWFPVKSLPKLQFPEANRSLIELLLSTYNT
ncbi:MAG: NUDIX domain-containing protein [Planctomycetes bacterium]|nr:NUDIX domain-containing protein [Planctomycetota bacterium]MCH9727672.1 NUDIX domain-containing protein [Planctomycetota bacterium]MCH9775097.1 NUDIX domain-containing protein [Planctomycetota bacterium]MCH9790287.1 NUDIX domain-containing protein [Planctomycetota bacterium]MDF1744964.1 NUDIX domain-containing protein [Gimesia sp.]